MPKKKKKAREAASDEMSETTSEAVAAAVPEPKVTLPQAESVEKKKKKKSKVQVALNILRAEGVDSFQQYINQEITLTDSLRTLRDRILRAEDLGGMKDETMKVVDDRLKTLDRQWQCEEGVVIAEVKNELNPKEKDIFMCCINGEVRRLRRLLKFGTIDVNMAAENGTPLCYAASNGKVEVVKELLSMPGIGVNIAQKTGATPLFFAAFHRHVEVVKLLLAVSGINVNPKALEGMTPLHMAVQQGYEEIVKHLLAAPNINIEARTDMGETPLLLAVVGKFPGIVELLIKRGANINFMYDDFISLLCIAVDRGDVEIIKILLRAPAIKVDLFSTDGTTALYGAVRYGYREIVEMLLKNSADPNITYGESVTLLHLACTHGHTDIVKMLLNAGADIDAETAAEKYTPHGIAQLRGHQGIIALLEARRQEKLDQASHLERLSLEDKPDSTSPPTTPAIPPSVSASIQATQAKEASNTSLIETDSEGQSALKQTDSETHTRLPLIPVGEHPSVTETQSPLELAKNELIPLVSQELIE